MNWTMKKLKLRHEDKFETHLYYMSSELAQAMEETPCQKPKQSQQMEYKFNKHVCFSFPRTQLGYVSQLPLKFSGLDFCLKSS